MNRRWLIVTTAILLILTILSYSLLLNRTFQEKLGWHINLWMGRLRTWLNPPQVVAFSSNGSAGDVEQLAIPSPNVATMTPLPTRQVTQEPTATFAPLPLAYSIEGGNYFSQHNRWNYCGPANLAMALSYWGWEGTHDDVAGKVRTYNKDKNITPGELQAYAEEEAGMGMIIRVGGSLDTLKRIIAAGFPVIVEKGPTFRDIQYNLTWMGHYQVLSGYNDAQAYFIAQDSYIEPDYHQSYDTLVDEWRSFNYLYMIVYPPNLENDVLNLLGDDRNEFKNYEKALEKAQQEFYQLSGIQRFYALFNYGTNLVKLRDYGGAAKAYDQAFELYDALPDESIIPYRILWYQTGPFLAYYYSGRYSDVIEKATKNSIEMVRDNEPALEESYYWRGMARIASGEREKGIDDFYTCLQYHQGYDPCVEALNNLGIYP